MLSARQERGEELQFSQIPLGPLLDLASLAELQRADLIFRNSWDPEEEVVLAVCRLLWVIGGKEGKSGSPNCTLNCSQGSIPFLEVLGALMKKSLSWSGEQWGAGRVDAHILTSPYSGNYVCKRRFE